MKLLVRWTPIWIAAALTLMLAGCSSSSKISVKPEPKPAAVDSALDSISTQSSALAAQSQRDVEAILKARAAANQRASDQSTAAGLDDTATALANPPRRIVVWNDPKQAAAANPPGKAAVSIKSIEFPATRPAGHMGGAALEPNRLNALMVDLSRELYSTGAYSQTPLRELLGIAAMSMIDPKRSLDPQAIPDLTEKERELLGKLQTFFAELGKSLNGKDDPEQAIVEAVGKLRQALTRQPVLSLSTISLCTRVNGFGDYSPFDKYSFLAGSEQKAIVYLEIDDFTSELNTKNEYVTELAQQLTIYSDRDGIPVWKEDWQSAVDVTKNKRQDFFTVQVITLPKALSVGKYQLKVRVRDEKSQAEAESTIPFEMVADPKMASCTITVR